MATSQLGNHCKSKREGDIKGKNDEERKGGQRDERREVKTKRKRRRKQEGRVGWGGVSCSFYLLTVWETATLRQ